MNRGAVRRRFSAVAISAGFVAGLVGIGASSGSAATLAGHAGASRTAPPQYQWPKYALVPGDNGTTADPSISTQNAGQLGVRWMAPIQGPAYTSPVVAWSAALGRTVVYQGNENGYFNAFDANTGALLWSDNLGSNIRDTPLVSGGSVWVAPTYAPHMEKLDAATGALLCQSPLLASINYSTPTIGQGANGGTDIFVGENGVSATVSGPVYAINSQTCAIDWQFTSYNSAAGVWAPMSYATDANGRNLVLFGTDNPDSTVYAVDAATGAKVWSFYTAPAHQGGTENDVGVGPAVSPPGANGFADGVAYVPSQGGVLYAIDLTTGQQVWSFNFADAYHMVTPYSRATAAVVDNMVIFGNTDGVLAVNATTGQPIWHWADAANPSTATEVLSSATVVGPAGQRIVAVTDLSGNFDVLDAQTGNVLYRYQTGGFAIPSVAESDGNLYVSSSAGFLYDFAVGGANQGAPTTTVASPADGSQAANPNGNLTVTGTASGGPVASVSVAIQSGGSAGPWWNASTGSWTKGFAENSATLGSPGATSTGWSFAFPIPPGGGVYSVRAVAVASNGLADISAYSSSPSAARSSFSVANLPSAPHVSLAGDGYVAPGQQVTLSGSGFGASETVNLTLDGTAVGSTMTAADGTIAPVNVGIPKDAKFGLSAVTATGQTSGDTASASLDVSNEWASSGDDSTHMAFEPNDPTWNNHVAGSNQTFLKAAWNYPSGAAIRTSPAVFEGVAYIGDDNGSVTAVNIHTGAPIWSHPFDAGSAVDSSPAVASGLVLFGTTGGTFDAVSAADGALAWQVNIGSAIHSAPSVSNGTAYFGTADGRVIALALSDGHQVWSATVAGAVTASPSVDATGRLIVGDASGTINALSASTGSTLWTVTTGGPVTATASLIGGNVYVGSQDGNVYALKESSGAKVWTFSAGSPITAGGSYWNQGDYVFGDQAGDLYYLSLSKGGVQRHFTVGDAIVGESASVGWVVVNLAHGRVIGYKFPNQTSWRYTSPGNLASSVAIVDGVVYLTSESGMLTAFLVPGSQVP